jgi:hypothetical protein
MLAMLAADLERVQQKWTPVLRPDVLQMLDHRRPSYHDSARPDRLEKRHLVAGAHELLLCGDAELTGRRDSVFTSG